MCILSSALQTLMLTGITWGFWFGRSGMKSEMLHFKEVPGLVDAAGLRPTLGTGKGLVISKQCGSFEILAVKNTHGSQSRVPGSVNSIQGFVSIMYPGLKAQNLAT